MGGVQFIFLFHVYCHVIGGKVLNKINAFEVLINKELL